MKRGTKAKPWAVYVKRTVDGPWTPFLVRDESGKWKPKRFTTQQEAQEYRWGPLIHFNLAAVLPYVGDEPLTRSEEAMLDGKPLRSKSVPACLTQSDTSSPAGMTWLAAMAAKVAGLFRFKNRTGRTQ